MSPADAIRSDPETTAVDSVAARREAVIDECALAAWIEGAWLAWIGFILLPVAVAVLDWTNGFDRWEADPLLQGVLGGAAVLQWWAVWKLLAPSQRGRNGRALVSLVLRALALGGVLYLFDCTSAGKWYRLPRPTFYEYDAFATRAAAYFFRGVAACGVLFVGLRLLQTGAVRRGWAVLAFVPVNAFALWSTYLETTVRRPDSGFSGPVPWGSTVWTAALLGRPGATLDWLKRHPVYASAWLLEALLTFLILTMLLGHLHAFRRKARKEATSRMNV